MVDPHDPDIQDLDSEGVKKLDPIIKHHMRMRWVAISVAIAIIVAACILEYILISMLNSLLEKGDLLFLIAIAPIASITVIVSFILIGAFKKPDDSKIPLPGMVAQAAQSLTDSSN